MSTIIHTEDIFPFIEQELKIIESNLLVITAFAKVGALKKVDRILENKLIKKRLLVRFRKEDILYGSSDLELFDYCKQNGWELFINFDLHSKIFVFDKTRYLIGSANVTLSGLGISRNPNIETVCSGIVTQEELIKIEKFFDSSTKLTCKLFDLMSEQIEESLTNQVNSSWEDNILDSCIMPPEQLWVSEMIFSRSPLDMNSRDRALLDLSIQESGDIELVKEKFISSKCYRWLLNMFNDEIYFGELSAKLHHSIIDDPSPYRKDVKQLLVNLLNWINELEVKQIKIDRPNYSQRIKKII